MRLFIATLWSPAGKELTSWLLFAMSNCEVVTFPLVTRVRCGACLIVSIPDPCLLSYFKEEGISSICFFFQSIMFMYKFFWVP